MSRFAESIDLQNKLAGLKIGPNSGAVTTIVDQGIATRDINIPVGTSDTLVTLNYAQSLTNKTITDPTNVVAARYLFADPSGSAIVSVDTGIAPTTGQVLKAVTATEATWQDDSTAPPYTTYSSGEVTSLGGAPTTIQTIDASSIGTVFYITSNLVAKNASGAAQSASYTIRQAFRNDASILSSVGTYNDVVLFASTPQLANGDSSTGNVKFNISGTNIEIIVTGMLSQDITFRSSTATVTI